MERRDTEILVPLFERSMGLDVTWRAGEVWLAYDEGDRDEPRIRVERARDACASFALPVGKDLPADLPTIFGCGYVSEEAVALALESLRSSGSHLEGDMRVRDARRREVPACVIDSFERYSGKMDADLPRCGAHVIATDRMPTAAVAMATRLRELSTSGRQRLPSTPDSPSCPGQACHPTQGPRPRTMPFP